MKLSGGVGNSGTGNYLIFCSEPGKFPTRTHGKATKAAAEGGCGSQDQIIDFGRLKPFRLTLVSPLDDTK